MATPNQTNVQRNGLPDGARVSRTDGAHLTTQRLELIVVDGHRFAGSPFASSPSLSPAQGCSWAQRASLRRLPRPTFALAGCRPPFPPRPPVPFPRVPARAEVRVPARVQARVSAARADSRALPAPRRGPQAPTGPTARAPRDTASGARDMLTGTVPATLTGTVLDMLTGTVPATLTSTVPATLTSMLTTGPSTASTAAATAMLAARTASGTQNAGEQARREARWRP